MILTIACCIHLHTLQITKYTGPAQRHRDDRQLKSPHTDRAVSSELLVTCTALGRSCLETFHAENSEYTLVTSRPFRQDDPNVTRYTLSFCPPTIVSVWFCKIHQPTVLAAMTLSVWKRMTSVACWDAVSVEVAVVARGLERLTSKLETVAQDESKNQVSSAPTPTRHRASYVSSYRRQCNITTLNRTSTFW